MKFSSLPPALILKKQLNTRFVGKSYGPLVLVDPNARNVKRVVSHELVHSMQWWVLGLPVAGLLLWLNNPLFLFGFLVMPLANWIPVIRLHFECQAYAWDSIYSEGKTPEEYLSRVPNLLINYRLLDRYSKLKIHKTLMWYFNLFKRFRND